MQISRHERPVIKTTAGGDMATDILNRQIVIAPFDEVAALLQVGFSEPISYLVGDGTADAVTRWEFAGNGTVRLLLPDIRH